MSEVRWVDLGRPAVLDFSGPDAVRFLNGQVTQDVRRVVGTGRCVWSCVTDAKGKLQFRVKLMEVEGGVIRVVADEGVGEALEARLTRYLIADDVEVGNRSGEFRLIHVLGEAVGELKGVKWVACDRFGVPGMDGWVAAGEVVDLPGREMGVDEVEELRISNGVPAWGRELTEGMLPPEAGLEGTDIAYDKGCYIGQEVISRIKSAGKVNRILVRLVVPEGGAVEVGEVPDADGKVLGEITSVGPIAVGGVRPALGYVKRGVEPERLLRLPG